MFLGYRHKLLRKQSGLSQTELGKLIGVSKVSISNYEKGERIPSIEVLSMILKVFDVSADYMLGRELNVVCESEENLTLILSTNDINILREIRKRPVLYGKIAEDPSRFFESLAKNSLILL